MFKTANSCFTRKSTEFSYLVPDYEYSEDLGCPVRVEDRNLYEFIQSNADCDLKNILKQFLPEDDLLPYLGELQSVSLYEDSDVIHEDNSNVSLLDMLLENSSMLSQYRERYGLSLDTPDSDVISIMQKELLSYVKKNKKEVKKDEKTQEIESSGESS